ncbi:hypothetical protein [Gelidibacter salicanalis]|uniref:Uncharacterized protein n=1 Tax=Gelidibacter salicanalis TaxID=291193 RepID=A0A934KUP6_9FLAO|nr:hypothetical protein [Gelidibacter salicanalis]MBJ7880553.1 hypothetical protein [Gelidibacter salicanalis]
MNTEELLVENLNNGLDAHVGVFQAAHDGVFHAANVGVFHQHCFMSTTGRYTTGYALNLE